MLPSIILTGLVSALVASSHPINKRQAPPVISRCIMPNTVALTFVSRIYRSSELWELT